MAEGKHFKDSSSGASQSGSSAGANADRGSGSAQDLFGEDYEPVWGSRAGGQAGVDPQAYGQTFDPGDSAVFDSTIGTISDSSQEGGEVVRKRKRRRRRSRRARRRRIIIAVVVALVVGVLGCGAAFAWSAYGVYQDAMDVYAQADNLTEGLTGGDAEALEEAAAVIGERAASMADAVDGPLWAVASVLPVVGTDVRNVRELAGVLDALAEDALAPVAAEADSLNLGAIFSDGAVNVELVGELAELLVDVAPAVSEATATVGGLEEGSIGRLNSIISTLQGAMGTVDSLCSGLAELAPYLTDMLGADGARTYLILAHNTSELKSSGGFIGSVGTLTIEDGVFELGDFGSFNDYDRDLEVSGDTTYRATITDEEEALFTWTYGLHAGDCGVNPDFSREGEMSAEMWEYVNTDDEIDGVIALDSQVLASFLSLVGSVTTADGTEVTGENCVAVLGYDIYWEYFSDASYTETSNDEADALFAEVAELAFNAVVDNIGSVDLLDLVDVLAQSTSEYRLMLWMEDEEEEAALDALGVAGTISTDETTPVLGVYLETRNASKMSWYTAVETTFEKSSINGDGTTSYSVTTVIANTITEEEVENSSTYIHGTSNGKIKYDVYLYAPAGGTISDVKIEGRKTEASYYTIDGIMVGKIRANIAAGSSVTITYTVTPSAEAEETLTLRTTPLAQDLAVDGEAA